MTAKPTFVEYSLGASEYPEGDFAVIGRGSMTLRPVRRALRLIGLTTWRALIGAWLLSQVFQFSYDGSFGKVDFGWGTLGFMRREEVLSSWHPNVPLNFPPSTPTWSVSWRWPRWKTAGFDMPSVGEAGIQYDRYGVVRWRQYWLPLGFPALAMGLVMACVDMPDLLRRWRIGSMQCCVCRYHLRGNTSGICPECGAPIPESVWKEVSAKEVNGRRGET